MSWSRWLALALTLAFPTMAGADDAPADDAPADDEPADDEPRDDAPSDDEPSDDAPSDDEPSTPAPEIHEQMVVTATGQPRLLSSAPVQVRLIDEEEIRKSAATDAADLLRRAPGIPVMSQGISQRGGVSGLSLQGISANRTLVLVDGRPVVGDTGGVVDLAQFPAEMLERVEIVEGPMSALYGSAALGGVVNLITRTPRPGTSVSGRFHGGTDRSLQAGLDLSAADGRGYSFGATGSLNLADVIDLDPSTAATDLDRRTALSMRVIGGAHREGQHLTGSAMVTHDARAGVLGVTNNAIGHTEVYDSPKTHDRVLASVQGRHDLPDKLAELRWSLDGTDYAATLVQDLRDSPVWTERRTRAGLISTQGRFDLHVLPWLTGAFGVLAQRENLKVGQDRVEAGGAPRHLDDVLPAAEGTVEPWAQGGLRLFDDRLELVPGARLSVQQHYGLAVAPAMAIRVSLWPGASLRISGGRGYRAPSLKDRYLVFDHAALGYVVYGDPALRPESSWGANLSLEQRVGRRFSMRLGGFANRLTDLITFVYDGAASTSGLNVYRSTNVAGARTLGGQASAELTLAFLRATAAYRFVWAWSDDGFFLPDAPIHGLRVTLEGTIPTVEIVLFTGVSWESDRYVDATQGLRSPGMVRWDARISRTIAKKHLASAYVAVDNILNQRRDPDRPGDFRPVEGFRVVFGVRGALRFAP